MDAPLSEDGSEKTRSGNGFSARKRRFDGILFVPAVYRRGDRRGIGTDAGKSVLDCGFDVRRQGCEICRDYCTVGWGDEAFLTGQEDI